MKKLVVLLGLAMFVATSAFAIVDPDDNMLGLYWDANADTVCMAGNMGTLYVIMTNPTFDALYGIEYTWDYQEGAVPPAIWGKVWAATGVQDFGGEDNSAYAGFGAPLTTSPATVLVSMSVMDVGAAGLSLSLHGFTNGVPSMPGDLPVALLAADELKQLGTSTLPGTVTAQINLVDCGVVAVEAASWDSVKSMYR